MHSHYTVIPSPRTGRMKGVRMDPTAEVRLLRLLMLHCTPSLSKVEGCVVMPLHAWGDGLGQQHSQGKGAAQRGPIKGSRTLDESSLTH